jgi:hypothetical protein
VPSAAPKKAEIVSRDSVSASPFDWKRAERQHTLCAVSFWVEIERLAAIVRNPVATDFEKYVAGLQLRHLQQISEGIL